MKKTYLYCEFCGKDITGAKVRDFKKVFYIKIQFNGVLKVNTQEVCNDCSEKIYDFFSELKKQKNKKEKE